MSSHTNWSMAHDFYYKGVDRGEIHEYCSCSLSYVGRTAISYSTAIANFDASRLVCEVKMSESSTSWARYIVTEVSSSSVRADGVPESGQLFVRLVYGSIESNTATVE